ncbi:electron transport complex subunit G [Marinobacterium nitratireducens]|uniref:Ion-translocating oxidoreductase complex subunit G n=1 Tax=Marinobacterium nitratireducens TaxID=518897 RepID=A0A917ZHN4_9GAMM|nr:electron transport complex subunit RsxG [Marinobacterium nitratireducens]GGO83166.1 electron transport complex subunit G [Marinobacterium nitratireducens]
MQMLSAIRSSTVGIAVFAVVTAGLIAITQVGTAERIERNELEQQARALYEIVERDSLDDDLLDHPVEFTAPTLLGHERPATAYRGYRNGEPALVILPVVAPDGYTGEISLIVGINADASVAGVRVLAHKETPGLGDKVDIKKSRWVLGFEGQRKDGEDDPSWAVRKDGGRFDQFTGATITPRAVVNAVGRAVDHFREHRAELLGTEPQTQQEASHG